MIMKTYLCETYVHFTWERYVWSICVSFTCERAATVLMQIWRVLRTFGVGKSMKSNPKSSFVWNNQMFFLEKTISVSKEIIIFEKKTVFFKTFWCSFGAVLVQFWKGGASCTIKRCKLHQNCTTAPKLHQNGTKTAPWLFHFFNISQVVFQSLWWGFRFLEGLCPDWLKLLKELCMYFHCDIWNCFRNASSLLWDLLVNSSWECFVCSILLRFTVFTSEIYLWLFHK